MEQKPQDQQQENSEQLTEYQNFVKESANDGTYFKDALDWYLTRYVSPLCDRTVMFFVAAIAAFSFFFLIQIVDGLFPLVEQVPIVIKSKDQSVYTPFIKELKGPQDKDLSVDDAMAKYLLSIYVDDRENYDYRDSEVRKVNRKFNRIKNTSTYLEYKNFQLFMSKDANANSPLNDFGRNVFRDVEIKDVTFIKAQQSNYLYKIKNLFSSQISNEAEVRFTMHVHTFDENNIEQISSEDYLAKIKFSFSGVNRKEKTGVLDFAVNSYKLYKIK